MGTSTADEVAIKGAIPVAQVAHVSHSQLKRNMMNSSYSTRVSAPNFFSGREGGNGFTNLNLLLYSGFLQSIFLYLYFANLQGGPDITTHTQPFNNSRELLKGCVSCVGSYFWATLYMYLIILLGFYLTYNV